MFSWLFSLFSASWTLNFPFRAISFSFKSNPLREKKNVSIFFVYFVVLFIYFICPYIQYGMVRPDEKVAQTMAIFSRATNMLFSSFIGDAFTSRFILVYFSKFDYKCKYEWFNYAVSIKIKNKTPNMIFSLLQTLKWFTICMIFLIRNICLIPCMITLDLSRTQTSRFLNLIEYNIIG